MIWFLSSREERAESKRRVAHGRGSCSPFPFFPEVKSSFTVTCILVESSSRDGRRNRVESSSSSWLILPSFLLPCSLPTASNPTKPFLESQHTLPYSNPYRLALNTPLARSGIGSPPFSRPLGRPHLLPPSLPPSGHGPSSSHPQISAVSGDSAALSIITPVLDPSDLLPTLC